MLSVIRQGYKGHRKRSTSSSTDQVTVSKGKTTLSQKLVYLPLSTSLENFYLALSQVPLQPGFLLQLLSVLFTYVPSIPREVSSCYGLSASHQISLQNYSPLIHNDLIILSIMTPRHEKEDLFLVEHWFIKVFVYPQNDNSPFPSPSVPPKKCILPSTEKYQQSSSEDHGGKQN